MNNPLFMNDLIPLIFKDFEEDEIGRILTTCKTWLNHRWIQEQILRVKTFGKRPLQFKELTASVCKYRDTPLGGIENNVTLYGRMKVCGEILRCGLSTEEDFLDMMDQLKDDYNTEITERVTVKYYTVIQYYYNIDLNSLALELRANSFLNKSHPNRARRPNKRSNTELYFRKENGINDRITIFKNSKKLQLTSSNSESGRKFVNEIKTYLERIKLKKE